MNIRAMKLLGDVRTEFLRSADKIVGLDLRPVDLHWIGFVNVAHQP